MAGAVLVDGAATRYRGCRPFGAGLCAQQACFGVNLVALPRQCIRLEGNTGGTATETTQGCRHGKHLLGRRPRAESARVARLGYVRGVVAVCNEYA